ncbi:MAG TPA: hypothetical protein VMU39_05330, partial [Solirubrobacteraceae bacterium]|nr:hypothetical protein [Solirubrobacteraceae bacterium]
SRQLKQRAVRADYALKEPLSRPDETLARRWNVRSADGLDATSRAINQPPETCVPDRHHEHERASTPR